MMLWGFSKNFKNRSKTRKTQALLPKGVPGKATGVISKLYSEHVSSVEVCFENIFHNKNTIWSKKIEKNPKKFKNGFIWPPWEIL